MAKSGKAIYSKLNHIYMWSSIALKMYFSILCTLSCCTYLKSSIKMTFSQSSLLARVLYSILCVHLEQRALLCDPNILLATSTF